MNRTRSLTEGAVLAALFIILLLASFYLPLVGMFLMFTLSIPFIVYTYRHDIKSAVPFFIVALVVTYITVGPMTLPLTFMFGSSGIIMGYFYHRKKQAFTILVAGSLSFIANLLLVYVGSILILNINIIDQAKEMLKESFTMAENFLASTGQEPGEEFANLYEQIEMVTYIVPSGLVLLGVSLALISQLLANLVLKRLKADIDSFRPFREWSFPRSLLWYYLIVMFITLMGPEEGSTLFIIVMNAFVILETIMVVQGLSLIYYYSHAKGWKIGIPITITIFTFLIQILLYPVRILGIIDLGFDLRKRIEGKK